MKKIVQNLDTIMMNSCVDCDYKIRIDYLMNNPHGAYATDLLEQAGVTVQPRRRKRRIARLLIEQAPKRNKPTDIEYQLLEFERRNITSQA